MIMNRFATVGFFVKRYFFLLGLFLLVGCMNFLPNEVEFTHTQLQSWMQRRFPLEKKQSLVIAEISARLDQPMLTLDAEQQRVRLAARVQITVDTGLVRSGTIAVSGGVAFDPIRHALVLRNAVVEELQVEGIPPGILPVLGNLWLRDLSGISLYTLPAEQIKRFGKAFDNATITILPEAVLISR